MDARQQKIEKLKAMGLPIPIDKEELQQAVSQATVHVKDPKMLDRINQIKSGAAKRELKEILDKVDPVKGINISVKTKKNQHNPPKTHSDSDTTKAPALASFQADPLPAELIGLDEMFETDSRHKTINSSEKLGRSIQENVVNDDSGNDFIYKLKSRLQQKVKYSPTPVIPQSIPNPEIDMDKLEEKIFKISEVVAKEIAEQTIKNVLDTYLNKKQNLVENKTTFKKYKNNIIEIEGQFYKLTPIKVKKSN